MINNGHQLYTRLYYKLAEATCVISDACTIPRYGSLRDNQLGDLDSSFDRVVELIHRGALSLRPAELPV